ncbi:5-deoxy-glucuronate isomerase [Phototrophicus methaneseepsis]|uniref:5-deoxy-glucuronate isomerase n=1 Tax=Phototrophicus methaneseepsis TaxID=2710758 RepID=A0A7S8E6T6_9CHLR|nr:5-deoxy-glucuronate isomerase [Phototrophicus methaneseepsis]QPC81368.1 5-deoxy-glucuronate isomerase [Phototrophicus methaneseepsis]
MNYTSNNMIVKSQDNGGSGIFASVDAASAGWDYLNMAALRLNKGETYSTNVGEHEHVTVILGGRCHIRTSTGEYLDLGRRPNVFSGMPWALYLPRNVDFEIEALTDNLEVASCWVPTDEDHPAQLVTPDMSQVEIRGGANATRQINGILPPGFDCHRLVCVEVYTPSGNWSSYPPHKHDVHTEAEDGTVLEADLEEIYFYKIDNPNGYAYQRVYNDDRSIDGLMMAENHDAVLVPEGYHPVVSAHGYTTYYLNFLAGSAQSLANSDDPAYSWVKGTWTYQDPRLPIVHHGMEPR